MRIPDLLRLRFNHIKATWAWILTQPIKVHWLGLRVVLFFITMVHLNNQFFGFLGICVTTPIISAPETVVFRTHRGVGAWLFFILSVEVILSAHRRRLSNALRNLETILVSRYWFWLHRNFKAQVVILEEDLWEITFISSGQQKGLFSGREAGLPWSHLLN